MTTLPQDDGSSGDTGGDQGTLSEASVWISDRQGVQQLAPQPAVSFSDDVEQNIPTVTVDRSLTYQTMDGFGAAVTGSSAFLINTTLSDAQRGELLDKLFTDEGIRLSMVRHSIGASDFDLMTYSYNDMPPGQTDPQLSNFSIAYDQDDIIPVLQAIMDKNADLKIMGSPWSAPVWMKEAGNNSNGGWLDVAHYQSYANYFVKYVQAYEEEGLPIYAITLQNEPLHETMTYPSMRMDPGNQIAFLKNDIGPAFADAGLTTKIVVYDHNWDEPEYPIEVLDDADARTFAAGSAFHAYAGDFPAQSTVHDTHPDKDIWFTEISGGDWAVDYGDNLAWYMTNIIIGTTRNWAKSALFWNLALDQNSGPTNGGCAGCRGVVTINDATGEVTEEVEYYALGHASKFVDPGALRIESNTFDDIQNVAFENPDGSTVLIVFNTSESLETPFKVKVGSQSFPYSLPGKSAATFKWSTGE